MTITSRCTVLPGPTTLLADMDKLYVPGSLYWCVTTTEVGNLTKNPGVISEKLH